MADGKRERVVFLDGLRVVACFMVMLVHACEQFYLDADGNTCFASLGDARWVSILDSACRACVPLFVMASSYLLFPLARPTGDFFRRRFARVVVPFAVWSAVYTVAWHGNWGQLAFNFPMMTGGHLWFVPMLLGLYLLMPLLSPWAEKASEKEVRGWLLLWFFTTLFPFARRLWSALYGAPSFGAVPYLWGECPWNGFGLFHYVSGFFGYMLLGFYFRKFVPVASWGATLRRAVPLWIVGYAIAAGGFYFRIPFDGTFPLVRPYACAVDIEMSWEFCGLGVALTVLAYFSVLRKIPWGGWFYARVVRPVSEASYGVYLLHMLVLAPVVGTLKGLCPTPVAILGGAALTFLLAAGAGVLLRRLPKIGPYVA